MKPIGSTQLIRKALDNTDEGQVDVVKLASSLGIDVYAQNVDDPNFNARIDYKPEREKFEIYVNSSHPLTRQRFSIAHELSHYALEPDAIISNGSMDRSHVSMDNNEVDADALAAQVLMPDELIDGYFKEHDLSDGQHFTADDVTRIADSFYVSRAMAVQRLRTKGCAIPYLSFA